MCVPTNFCLLVHVLPCGSKCPSKFACIGDCTSACKCAGVHVRVLLHVL